VAPATAAVDPAEKELLAKGYKIEMHNGERLFCRREEVLGSRLGAGKVCGTKERLKHSEQESKDFTEESQRHRITPDGR
jgi:hypothetical protein